ncbi:MAG: hypothetical protein OEO20_04000 [Gemmatimonadota bacterium]|nr:hypothetical protein [Gemmatimonadota bacterium]MDH3368038.1 hypothetical protein [Gemmatimonadota bacterium]MDH3477448.1 hypothetical protein [Gemmatimonadota bacterium]MDH3570703.1 hypothetical protein [Gemmatimonadota bacterium]MDH5551580.1 hypothetical protein [Gemmatimonadota bacterium]
MNARTFREGILVGLLGAAIIAAWFFVVDAVAGRPFFTPAMLGSAFFWGLRDPLQVQITMQTVLAYSMAHVLSLVLVGLIASAVASQVERTPSTLFLAIVLFAAFEFGFYIVVAVLGQPLLGALAWWSVAASNAVAAAGMGYALWRLRPNLRARLAKQPLGVPVDESSDTYRKL